MVGLVPIMGGISTFGDHHLINLDYLESLHNGRPQILVQFNNALMYIVSCVCVGSLYLPDALLLYLLCPVEFSELVDGNMGSWEMRFEQHDSLVQRFTRPLFHCFNACNKFDLF